MSEPRDRVSAPIPQPPDTGLRSWAPGLWVLRHYRSTWLVRDLGAGIVLTAMLVPAGLGYAEASGLPAITGLYATIAPLLVYALLGPSRIMVLGPDSALAPLIAVVVATKAPGDPARAIFLAGALALITGTLCLAGGLLKAGFITDLLSKPVRVGYLNGIGATMLVTQMPKLFGFKVSSTDVVGGAKAFFDGVLAGKTEPIALALGGGVLAVVLLTRLFARRAPGVLVAMVLATILTGVLGLDGRVSVVGPVPRGLPTPSLPLPSFSELSELFLAAVGIAVVAFADTSVLSRTLSARSGARIDANRELVALGAANIAAGLFNGFPISSSSSRTPVAEAAGSRTQLTGVVSAILIAVLLSFAPSALQHLPISALAAVVIAAAIRMFDVETLRVSWRVRRSDFVLSLVALIAVLVFGVMMGIAIAVAVSLLDVVRRVWRPHDAILGRAPGVKGYHDVTRYTAAKQVPGLILFRWDAPLFFANADTFRERVLESIDEATHGPIRWVVVAAEPIIDVDTTAAEMLEELDAELATRNVELAFAEMKDPVKDRLQHYGLEKRIGREFFFPTIGVAVKAYREKHPVEWVDWEENGS